MKILQKYLLLVLIISLCVGCGDDDTPPSELELAFEKLSGTWDMSQGGSIMIDNQDASLNFVGFSLSFTDGEYSTSNAGELFNATGTWEWSDQDAQRLSLDDGKLITIVELTETRFVFSFQFTGSSGQANLVDGVSGNYMITVNK